MQGQRGDLCCARICWYLCMYEMSILNHVAYNIKATMTALSIFRNCRIRSVPWVKVLLSFHHRNQFLSWIWSADLYILFVYEVGKRLLAFSLSKLAPCYCRSLEKYYIETCKIEVLFLIQRRKLRCERYEVNFKKRLDRAWHKAAALSEISMKL